MRVIQKVEQRFGAAEGTMLAMLCVVMVKAIGALYKIPLCNLLGGYAVGLYQMIFPVFSIMLVLSGSGVPLALTKLISSGYDGKETLKKSLLVFSACGLFFTLVLFFFGKNIAQLQGNIQAEKLYKAISPSVFLVSQIACFRGYFQGKSNLKPTAFSQVIEQVVKCVIGTIAVYFLPVGNVEKAFYACVAVTVSEIFALMYFIVLYIKKLKNENAKKSDLQTNLKKDEQDAFEQETIPAYKDIFVYVLPLTLTALSLPIAAICDSFIAINVLKKSFGERATELYGLYGGAVETIIGLPSAALMCFATGVLPKMNKEKNGDLIAFKVTFVLSALCAVFVAIFPSFIVKLLFGGLKNKELLIKMLRVSAINIVMLCLLQTSSAVMLSKGKQKMSCIFTTVGAGFKILLDFLLIPLPEINIFGLIISDFGCYFLALSLNILYIYKVNTLKRKQSYENNADRFGRRLGRSIDKST